MKAEGLILLDLISHIAHVRIQQREYFRRLRYINESTYECAERGLLVGFTHVMSLERYIPDVNRFFDTMVELVGAKYYECRYFSDRKS